MSKTTYKVYIPFEYDGDEEAPLTGKPIKSGIEAIDAVRDELDEIPSNEFVIVCEVYKDGVLTETIRA